MPETIQVRTTPMSPAATTAAPLPSRTTQTEVELILPFEIASMQLTAAFKLGALQLRPSSKLIALRLAPSQQPQSARDMPVMFEIVNIQPSAGGLGTVRLIPTQHQRPVLLGTPSLSVEGLQIMLSDFETAPIRLMPSTHSGVLVSGTFQIATVEFSPSFEIASIALTSTAKQVSVQLPGPSVPRSGAVFEIQNLQLGVNGEIDMMQLFLVQPTSVNPISQRAVVPSVRPSWTSEPGETSELERITSALATVLKPAAVGPWLHTPNQAFEGSTPAQLVERGESGRLWWMIDKLESGEPD